MEEINLDSLNDLNTPSVDFGGGIELLMNDKKKGDKKASSISLEDELKELDMNNFDEKPDKDRTEKFELNSGKKFSFNKEIPIAKETSNLNTGPSIFKHMDEINVEQETKQVEKMTKEELLKEKFMYLRKLEALDAKGVTLSKRYTMESSLDEMKGEYEFIVSEKERKNSVQFQGKVLTTLITGLEFLNNKFDPFDIKLDGWSEQVHENVEDYDEIFADLHEKYKSKAKMAPELKILFQLAASGMMIHMTNTMFKSSIPGMDDIMRQNPDLMNQFTKAAVNSMENTTPGLGNFMNDFRKDPNSNSNSHSRNENSNRSEMKGPENINTILSGLNKKISMDNESAISVEEIDLMGQSNMASRRKRRSDKNTISLTI
uniref:Uncharacterized protein n=1 Tax=viral metagenome TaxID=1070528 RepID=A0A6C0ET47_9ZZZZ